MVFIQSEQCICDMTHTVIYERRYSRANARLKEPVKRKHTNHRAENHGNVRINRYKNCRHKHKGMPTVNTQKKQYCQHQNCRKGYDKFKAGQSRFGQQNCSEN